MFRACIALRIGVIIVVLSNRSTAYHQSLRLKKSSTLDAVIVDSILEKCIGNADRLLVLSSETTQSTLYERIHGSGVAATVILGDARKSADDTFEKAKHWMPLYVEGRYFRYERKAQGFMVVASSPGRLDLLLKKIQNSRWWNVSGILVVVSSDSDREDNCGNAYEFLRIAWEYNLLSAIFICLDSNGTSAAYSYNPYGDYAPRSWQRITEYEDRLDHSWILFKFRYRIGGGESCDEIFFDKTRRLFGYPIRVNAAVIPVSWFTIDRSKSGLDAYGGEDGVIMRTILQHLNASVEEISYNGTDPLGYFDSNGTYYGLLSDVYAGRVDIAMNARYMMFAWRLDSTYPHTTSGMCFAVRSRGDAPRWASLAFIFDPGSSFGFVCVVILAVIFLSRRDGLSSGCLNGVRLLATSSLLRLPAESSARIFLSHIFVGMLILNQVLQGRMISLLNKHRSYVNPESLMDLRRDGYSIVAYPPWKNVIVDPILKSRFESYLGARKCLDRLREGERIACFDVCPLLEAEAIRDPVVHIMEERFPPNHVVFLTAFDWPLLRRFDLVLERLRDAGLISKWEHDDLRDNIPRSRSTTSDSTNVSILKLTDILFIFYGLSVGSIFALAVFVCETFAGGIPRSMYPRCLEGDEKSVVDTALENKS